MILGCVEYKKGKSLLEFVDNFVVIDINCTGHTLWIDDILDISAIKVVNCNVVDTFYTMVKPFNYIDKCISESTGLTNDMLKNAPSIENALRDFISFIGDNILVAHYAGYAINFICAYSWSRLDIAIHNNFIDTIRWSKKLVVNSKSHKLDVLADYLNLVHKPSKNSMDDCYSILELYENLRILEKTFVPVSKHKKNCIQEMLFQKLVIPFLHIKILKELFLPLLVNYRCFVNKHMK